MVAESPPVAAEPALIEALAEEMLGVFTDHVLVRRTAYRIGELSLDDAYRVQDAVIARREARGERAAGWKVGCTSRAIQTQFGLTEPVCARIMRPHVLPSGAAVAATAYLGCAVEPELVFRIARDIDPGDLSEDALLASIGGVSPGIELHNYAFVHGAPTSQELVASNAIHAGVVLSDDVRPCPPDIAREGSGVWVDDELVASAIAAEILGSGPIASLAWLARNLERRGLGIRAGELVLLGSPVGLVRVGPGQRVRAGFTRFGDCVVDIT